MRSKTKIVVLHMKEVIYTAIFIALGIVLVLLLFFMFGPGRKNGGVEETAQYNAGVYTSSLRLDGKTVDVQVVVDENHINSVSLINLDETVATMYPLLQDSMDSISQQIYEEQSTENISYTTENQYTATVLLDAVDAALEKAKVEEDGSEQ
ncbi:MAG: hypothetical protein LIO39_05030 [Lachnospiraceae bacterium]|nr:hypothetical protein [Lachnospiraceae bacterium]